MNYKTIKNDGICEEDIKKSRFICHLKRVTSEEEAREFITSIKISSMLLFHLHTTVETEILIS